MANEGDRLKQLRTGRRLSQQALADRSGISRSQIAKTETGKRRMTATDAAFLAAALGVNAHDLIGRPGVAMHFRKGRNASSNEAADIGQVQEWLASYVEDAKYIQRRLKRYGLG